MVELEMELVMAAHASGALEIRRKMENKVD
jgi:hypothetical protein